MFGLVTTLALLAAFKSVSVNSMAWGLPECCDDNTCGDKQGNEYIQKIHVVFMTHLDVGYTINEVGGGGTNTDFKDVCDKYFTSFLPLAFNLSDFYESDKPFGDDFYYKWTQFPWLLMELFSSTGCTRITDSLTFNKWSDKLLSAIIDDKIIWNGGPFSSYFDASHPLDFEYGLTIKNELNDIFNKNYGKVMKSSDVPGLPSSIVPYLYDAGIKAIHMGFGNGIPIPNLPNSKDYLLDSIFDDFQSKIFIWNDTDTGKSVIVMLEQFYGEWIKPDNSNETLAFFFELDNGGPPDYNNVDSKVQEYYDCLSQSFPNAEIINSSLDYFYDTVLSSDNVYNNLPVIDTKYSIGDVWVYGIQSDPFKVSAYKHAMRYIKSKLDDSGSNISKNDFEYKLYLRRIQKMMEHNWGRANNKCNGIWTVSDVSLSGSKLAASEWEQQRNYVYPEFPGFENYTFNSEWSDIFDNLTDYFDTTLKPEKFSINNDGNNFIGEVKECGNWKFKMSDNGQFEYLQNSKSCYNYATTQNTFGQLKFFINYQAYLWQGTVENSHCYGRISECSRDINYDLFSSSYDSDSCKIELEFNNTIEDDNEIGAPETIILLINLLEFEIDYEIYWFDKGAACAIQAFEINFNLPFSEPLAAIDSLGTEIYPKYTMENAVSSYLGFGEYVKIHDESNGNYVKLESLDNSLVIFGQVLPLLNQETSSQVTFNQPDNYSNVHLILYNNWWGQAFPQWYNMSAIWRIKATFPDEINATDCDDIDIIIDDMSTFGPTYIEDEAPYLSILTNVYVVCGLFMFDIVCFW